MPKSEFQYTFCWGLITGAIAILVHMLMMHVSQSIYLSFGIGMLGFVADIAVVIAALVIWKRRNNGYMTYNNAFAMSFVVQFLGLMLKVAFMYVLYNLVDPSLPEGLKEKFTQNFMISIQNSGMSDAEINELKEKIEMISYNWNGRALFNTLASGIITCGIYSFVLARIYRSKAAR